MPNIGEYVCELFSFGDNIRRYWRKRLSPGAELGHTKTPNHADGNGAQCVCAVCPALRPSRGNAGGKFFVLPKGKKIEPSCVKWALGCVRCVGILLAGKAKRMLSSFAHVACSLMGVMCTTRTGWLRYGNYLFINISAT